MSSVTVLTNDLTDAVERCPKNGDSGSRVPGLESLILKLALHACPLASQGFGFHTNAYCYSFYRGKGMDPHRWPSTDEWVMQIQYVFTAESYTAVQKNEMCRKMDRARKYYVKWGSQAERGKHHMSLLIYGS